jgi:SPP1 gp7 family putative phage head morphogenesis protein
VTRGPQPPDVIVASLQELIRHEFATVVLPRVLAELDRAGELRTDAIPTFGFIGSLLTPRVRNALKSAAMVIAQTARAGVARVVRPERATRIPVTLETAGRAAAGYVERVEGSAIGDRLVAALTEAFEKAERAGNKPGREEIEKSVEDVADRAASTVKSETQALHAEFTEGYSRAAGLTKYVWTTQLDEKVRPGHEALEGTIQLWNEPPVTHEDGHHAHPGEDRFCRCQAFPWDDGTAIDPDA